ncbi:MAG: DNA polymerase III subunit beta [Bacteroidetes bacterium]|jgi:DNA polymerase-3 subunit beta|nr:DNA polymerase III subunit beta [Bacteroidota bacterium]
MKFTTASADLREALTTVAGAVPSKSTLPILESILFERDGDTLRLSATDLEISIVQQVPVQFQSNGTPDGGNRVAVPAKRLLDTMRALPDLPIEFAADGDFNIKLTTSQGHYKMVGHDGADYPAIPELDEAHEITADAPLLTYAIQKTSFAVSKDALRPAMMGIYFQITPEHGRAVATDGHRLVKLTLEELTTEDEIDFIVPEKALSLAKKVAGDGSCAVRVDESYVSFDFETARVIARLIDESYPNYEAVIPGENDKRLVIEREALLAAVKRVGLYSSSMTNQIRLSLGSDQLEISAEDVERSSEAKETVACEYDNEEMLIGFNAEYLREVLSNLDADEVAFDFSSPNRAGVVMPLEQEEDRDLLMLIMPVMLNTYA